MLFFASEPMNNISVIFAKGSTVKTLIFDFQIDLDIVNVA